MTENVDTKNQEDQECQERMDADQAEGTSSEETEENVEELCSEKKDDTKKDDEDFRAKYYYLAAEMDNMHKRFNRERENLVKYGNEKILSSLIEVLDSFDHTIKAIELDKDEKVVNICKGILMVKDQFLGTLEKNGLAQIQAMGEVFDPNFHEALAQQPAEGKKDEEVIMEYQKGYTLNGRVLRASKVVIAKNN